MILNILNMLLSLLKYFLQFFLGKTFFFANKLIQFFDMLLIFLLSIFCLKKISINCWDRVLQFQYSLFLLTQRFLIFNCSLLIQINSFRFLFSCLFFFIIVNVHKIFFEFRTINFNFKFFFKGKLKPLIFAFSFLILRSFFYFLFSMHLRMLSWW